MPQAKKKIAVFETIVFVAVIKSAYLKKRSCAHHQVGGGEYLHGTPARGSNAPLIRS
jgi:hypothetical protein